MKRRNGGLNEMTELRRRAERRLNRVSKAPLRKKSPPKEQDALKQLHELHVHQIELEMQNQELQRIRGEVEEALARYTALYDFAPAGYFTLDLNGVVKKVNLSGAKLLGQPRSQLIGRRFADFVRGESRDWFAKFLERVFRSSIGETLELELAVANRPPLFTHVEAIVDDTEETCRVVVVDITARREAEKRVDELLRQNRALTRRMFNVQETERRDLARELHDELGQWITGIQAEAEALRNSTAVKTDSRLSSSVHAIGSGAGEIHRLIRQMLRRLRPSLLDTLGLTESLQELTARWKEHHAHIACELEVSREVQHVPESLGITIYRIVQEALTNAAKHSNAERVSVRLQRKKSAAEKSDCLQLTVKDDGRGMDLKRLQSGFGLMGMRERVIAAGGEFDLQSRIQHGVEITVRLPFAAPTNSEIEHG